MCSLWSATIGAVANAPGAMRYADVGPLDTTSLAAEPLFAVMPSLEPLTRGLRRGATVGIGGEAQGVTSLALALISASTKSGAWAAAVGFKGLGLVAAEELGVDLSHLALVPVVGRRWSSVVGALLDGMEVVALRLPSALSPGEGRRLAARARDRRCTLLLVGVSERPENGYWLDGLDLRLSVLCSEWIGLGEGFGRLQARQLEVASRGRRAAVREVRTRLWLPAMAGGVDMAPP